MRFVVTGGTGFIGRHLLRGLLGHVAPGPLHLVMTGAYHAFPETTGRAQERAADGGEEEISAEAAAMAYLMRGVHS